MRNESNAALPIKVSNYVKGYECADLFRGTGSRAMATGRKPAMNKYTQRPHMAQFMKLLQDYWQEKEL